MFESTTTRRNIQDGTRASTHPETPNSSGCCKGKSPDLSHKLMPRQYVHIRSFDFRTSKLLQVQRSLALSTKVMYKRGKICSYPPSSGGSPPSFEEFLSIAKLVLLQAVVEDYAVVGTVGVGVVGV